MNVPHRPDRPRSAAPSATGGWGPSLLLLATAAGLLLGALAAWWTSAPPAPSVATARQAAAPPLFPELADAWAQDGEPSLPVAATNSLPVRSVAAATAPGTAVTRPREPDGDPTPDLSDYLNPGERPAMAEVIQRLHQAGVHTGLGAFAPPGTRPPLLGIAVPEDFPLPDGYVRHHQATDDGQRIEAVLMFAPDRQFRDAAGRPIAVPPDRVVPPELAPPGLPLRRIVLPAPIEAARPGS
jgi:hypothetical protein